MRNPNISPLVPWVPETFDGLGENLLGITFLKMTFSRKMMFES